MVPGSIHFYLSIYLLFKRKVRSVYRNSEIRLELIMPLISDVRSIIPLSGATRESE